MKAEKILNSSLLDLLFENRNKQYGAYELRKNYGFRLKKAIFTTIASVLLIFFLLTSFKKEEKIIAPKENGGGVILHTPNQDEPKKKIEPKKPEVTKKAPKNPSNSVPLLVDYIPKNINNPDLPNNPNGDENYSGPTTDGPIGDIPNGGGGGKDSVEIKKDEPIKILPAKVEEPAKPSMDASYPGGKVALGEYLQDKLGDEAIEDGIEKKITVSFWIEIDGTITNVKAENNDDNTFIAKTIKAFLKMKKWHPALQNGEAIRTFKIIPVTILPNE